MTVNFAISMIVNNDYHPYSILPIKIIIITRVCRVEWGKFILYLELFYYNDPLLGKIINVPDISLQVILPIGVEVLVEKSYEEFINVFVTPSAADWDITEGNF